MKSPTPEIGDAHQIPRDDRLRKRFNCAIPVFDHKLRDGLHILGFLLGITRFGLVAAHERQRRVGIRMMPFEEQPPDDFERRVAVRNVPPALKLRAVGFGQDLALDGIHRLVVVDQQRRGKGHQPALLCSQPARLGALDLPAVVLAQPVERRGIRLAQLPFETPVLHRLHRCGSLRHVLPGGFGHGRGIHSAERSHGGLLRLNLRQIGHGGLHLRHDLCLHVAHIGHVAYPRNRAHHRSHLLQGCLLRCPGNLLRTLGFHLLVCHVRYVLRFSIHFILRRRPQAAARRSP